MGSLLRNAILHDIILPRRTRTISHPNQPSILADGLLRDRHEHCDRPAGAIRFREPTDLRYRGHNKSEPVANGTD